MFLIRLSLLLCLFLSFSAFSMSTVENVNCPQQFIASVQDVVDESPVDHGFAKVKVIFKRLRVIKGDVPQNIIVEVLKHGPIEFIKNETYSIQLQDGRLCWAEKK